MRSSVWRKKNFSHATGGMTRKVWAIKHRLGVSLVEARSGVKAARKAEQLMGECAGPYEVLRNQDLEIVGAKAMGARIL